MSCRALVGLALVGLALVGLASAPAALGAPPPSPGSSARLGPGAEARAARLGRALARALDRDPPLVGVDEARIRFMFREGPKPELTLALGPPDGIEGLATPHGRLSRVSGEPAIPLSALAEALAGEAWSIPWLVPDPPLPSYRALPAAPPPPDTLPEHVAELLSPGRHPDPGELLAALAAHPLSPRLWVGAASATRRVGDAVGAAALADVAARLDPGVRTRTGWQEAAGLDGPAVPGTAWFLLAAAALWLALAWPCGTRVRLAVLTATALAGVAFWSQARPPPAPVALPAPPPALHAALAGGACQVAPPLWSGPGWRIVGVCEGAPVTFDVVWSEGAARVESAADRQSPTVEAARLTLAVAAAGAQPPPPGPRFPSEAAASALVRPARDRHALGVAAALAVAALLALLALQLASWRHLARAASESPWLSRVLAVVALGATATAALMPAHLVLVYTGYDLTARLAGLGELPRYGAGVVWLYRPFLELLGVEVGSLQLANRLFGLLTLGPLLAATHLLARRPAAVTWAAALFVGLPVFWRDHASEGMQAGVAFLLASGLAGLLLTTDGAGLDDPPGVHPPPDRRGLVAAVPTLALAMSCRPEALPAVALAVLGLLVGRARPRKALLLGAAAAAVALVPHLGWLLGVVSDEVSTAGIVGLDHALHARALDVLLSRNIFVADHWVPLAATLAAAVGLAAPGRAGRAVPLGLAAAALAWILLSAVDLPRVSIPRVHLPAVVLLIPVMALGAAAWATSPDRRRRLAHVALALAATAAAALSLPDALAGTRNDAEEQLIRAARAAVTRTHAPCLATLDFEDSPPPGKTQRHFPRHRFEDVPVVGLLGLLDRPGPCGEGTVVLLGARCFMAMRSPEAAAPAGLDAAAACRRARAELELVPIVEWSMSNTEPPGFPMYPTAPELPVGVYTVGGRR